DGQVHGGIVQSVGQAMFEEAVYDENGQLITGELMDYAIPRAADLPWIETSRTVTPSPVNPLGLKGIGEAGTIGATPCVANAVADALAPFGVKHVDLPFKRERIWRLMRESKPHAVPAREPAGQSGAGSRSAAPASAKPRNGKGANGSGKKGGSSKGSRRSR
ncbi:MAG TPA: molybdopterin cofactor-binding domain-containing protein, partial [Candidatus Acidoferrales bacterium]|nr:molybdopterin cofactor-binding domain-containing protein [Candidatus Acidoferrales bacterium]